MSRSRVARLLAVPLGLLLLGWLLSAAPAAAHAALVSTDPADGQVLDSSPAAITLTFNEPVQLTDGIELLSGDGTVVDADVRGANEVITITPSEDLADGTYVVGWRIISEDTHPVAGGFSFSVGEASATSITLPVAQTPPDVDLLRKGAEALRYGGLLVAAGALVFGVAMGRRALRRSAVARRRLVRTALAASVLSVVGAWLLAPLTVLWQRAEPLTEIGGVVLEAATWRTSIAAAALVLTVASAVAAATVRRLPEVALSAAAVGIGSLAIVGHTRTFGPVWLVLAADVTHVVAAAVWLGGLVGLLVLFSAGRAVRAGDLQEAVRRFSAVALSSVAVVSVSGAVLWWRVPHTVRGLPDSSYGVHLIVKVALVVVVVGIGAWNLRHLRAHRQLAARQLRRTVGVEALILAVVVAVTAGMVTQVPRPQAATAASAEPAEPASVVRELDFGKGYTGTLTLTPGDIGTNAAQLDVRDAEGGPVSALEPVTVSVGIEAYDLGPFRSELAELSAGSYEGSIDLPIAGDWRIQVAVRTDQFTRVTDAADLEVEE